MFGELQMKSTPFKIIAASILLLLGFASQAAEQAPNDELTRLLKQRLGTDQVAPPIETGIEGVYMTRFGNKFAYLIDGGRYVFIGDLIDLEQARNLTEVSRRKQVVDELAGFDIDKQIVFPAAGEEKAVLNVFTDTSCGYCQQLHREVDHLQEAGISVHYFPFPRGGSRGPGYHSLRQVWCSEDRQSAIGIAKGVEEGKLEASDSCSSAQVVDEGYRLGNRLGVSGTPSLFTSDGTRFNGYVPYQQLIPQLLGEQ
ncbi:MAG TPA: DsbC family protein [Gammaproteobacteria bacterium]|nr:DsbC family protein [Gammaproteobacteria bacterium]